MMMRTERYLVTNDALVLRCEMVNIPSRIELTNGGNVQLGILSIFDDGYFSSVAIPVQ
jgi:hypothetical protein